MTYNERDIILKDSEFIGKVRIAFCDWLEYWAVNGTSNIQDEDTKGMTEALVKLALDNPETYVNKLAVLAISESAVKNATEITDANVTTAVTNLLTHALPYLM